MEQRQSADGGSIIRTQKHDSRINKAQELLLGRLSDMAGEMDNVAVTASSTPTGKKSSKTSSPTSHELTRTRSVEKFVYETDSSQLPELLVDPVSTVFILSRVY